MPRAKKKKAVFVDGASLSFNNNKNNKKGETGMPRAKKKKAVFVDGASLSFMRQPLGIGHMNFDQLHKILVEKVGKSKELSASPICTISPRIEGLESFKKNLRIAGFVPEVKDPVGEEDDRFIIEKIQELDPKAVSEIVIVTSDRDYVPCLREKVGQGIKVLWAAVVANGKNDRPMISMQLQEIFRSGEFEFVDLSQWKDELRMTPWAERPRKQISGQEPIEPQQGQRLPADETVSMTKTIKVVMEMTVVRERVPGILHSIGSLMGNVSRLKGIVKATTTTTEAE